MSHSTRLRDVYPDTIALADALVKRKLSPQEAVECALDAIARDAGRINAVVSVREDISRAEIDRAVRFGPFHGVPYLVKDLGVEILGLPHTQGSRSLRSQVSKADDRIIEHLRTLGLIPIGKTNTPEFGLRPTTEPELFGACGNPWRATVTPGGSSGGSAASVAAGWVTLAHANDGGGSIRIPASCCGLVGFKPGQSPGSISYTGRTAVDFFVTPTVRDSELLWRALGGVMDYEPRPLRVAWSDTAPEAIAIDPSCVQAVALVVGALEEMGHRVTESAPAYEGANYRAALDLLTMVRVDQRIDEVSTSTGVPRAELPIEPLTRLLADRGQGATAAEIQRGREAVQAVASTLQRFFDSTDLWVTSTVSEPAPALGTFDDPVDLMNGWARGWQFNPYLALANVGRCPAISIPVHQTADGLPVGIHLMARPDGEALLLDAARAIESTFGLFAGGQPAIDVGRGL